MSLSKQASLSYEQLVFILEKEDLIFSRLEELVQSGCVVIKDNRYELTHSGSSLANFLNIFGIILGRGVGG